MFTGAIDLTFKKVMVLLNQIKHIPCFCSKQGEIMGSKKEIMRKHELVVWIADEIKKGIDKLSRPCSRGMFLKSLRDDPDNHIVSICSEICNWKIRAEDDTGLTVEQMNENDEQQVAQEVVEKLVTIFAAEISRLRRG